jgi:CheY-like chemotaxis protein
MCVHAYLSFQLIEYTPVKITLNVYDYIAPPKGGLPWCKKIRTGYFSLTRRYKSLRLDIDARGKRSWKASVMPAEILVVEDNADAREILLLILKDQGFKVIAAEDGQAALEVIKSQRPDLIITDIEMPNLDGVGLIKELRKQPAMADVPILIMTAYQGRIVSDAIKAGADAVTNKPVGLETIITLVKQMLVLFILACLDHHSLDTARRFVIEISNQLV